MMILNVLGVLASIIGALVSVWGARKAIQAKNEIVKKIHINKYSKIKTIAESSRNELRKIITSSEKLRGINYNIINDSLLLLIDILNEEKKSLEKSNFKNISEILRNIEQNSKQLRDKRDDINIKDVGNSLYEVVNIIISEITDISSSSIESN